MLMALTTKNKINFVDGSISRPSPNDLLFSEWNRSNNMVISRVLNSISREISDNLLYIDTTNEISEDLHDRFH